MSYQTKIRLEGIKQRDVLKINLREQDTLVSLKMKLILCMVLGILLISTILGQLLDKGYIGPFLSYLKTVGVHEESSSNKESGKT